jgi:phage shock protein PspC (stress-responsive transcriptional regulator)
MGVMDAVLITLFIITWIVCIVIVNIFIYETYKEEHDGITTGQTIVMYTIGMLPFFNQLYVIYWLIMKAYRNRKIIFKGFSLKSIVNSFKVLKL